MLASLAVLAILQTGGVSTPKFGSKERTAILDAVRPFEGGPKVKFLVECLQADGNYAYFRGRPSTEKDQDGWSYEYFLKREKTKWVAKGQFLDYWEGAGESDCQAYDFSLLKDIGFPIKLIGREGGHDYVPMLHHGLFRFLELYGKPTERARVVRIPGGEFLYKHEEASEVIPYGASEVRTIRRASYDHPIKIAGLNCVEYNAVEKPSTHQHG